MRVLDLFSGIGGFSLGLERAGMETVAFCEIEEYPRKVLAKHWPNIPCYEDVRDVSKQRLDADGIGRIDVITGGFPCQDISVAGKQAGIEGERSGLWGELARIIGDIRPRYAIVENVTALISGDNGAWFGTVLRDLAQIGYDCEWHCIPASELGAHHHRDRVWIIAYPANSRRQKRENIRRAGPQNQQKQDHDIRCESRGFYKTSNDGDKVPNSDSQRSQRLLTDRTIQEWSETVGHSGQGSESPGRAWAIEPAVGRVANGVPRRVDRLKGLGNAVVPQIPELIGRAIMEIES